MPEFYPPFLVYNRIDHNRKAARRLLVSFALAALPVVSAGVVVLLPFLGVFGGIVAYAIYGQALKAKIESLDQALRVTTMPTLFELPHEVLLIIATLLAAAALVTLIGLVAVTAFLIARFGARMVLRLAGAHPARRNEQPELFQVVENLCIGAGLPMPAIYLIDADAPNAFATGRAPANSSLVVTRGLLALLDRRELEGVVAHELSHIGNHDIRLTTTLTAVVGTLSLPLRIVTAPVRAAFQRHSGLGTAALVIAVAFFMPIIASLPFGVTALARGDFGEELPVFLRWWAVHAMLAPVYAVAVAPLVALAIRQAVSRQREFLADADAALLTRDPDGLAMALAKIGAATGQRTAVREASVHLYIVDPNASSLLHRIFPSHPPLEQRIRLLEQMGSGMAVGAQRL
jgi:heat shock protein HtpX